MAEDGREATETKTKKGGYRTLPFILGNEVGDIFAMAGFQANMISYLTSQLHLPLVEASNTLNNFAGTSSITPIVGALVADCFAGRFFTIVGGSLIYQLGMVCLIISAVLPALRPPPCPPSATACQRAATWQLLPLYASLLLTSIGSGGIRPNVVTFGADQFEANRPRPKFGFFNLYFFSMNLSVLLALTVIVYIQDNVGWGWGFGIPAVVMLASMLAFATGYRIYVRMMPAGSPLTRLAQVVVAAFKKRGIELPADSGQLYGNKELDADISTTGKLLHTDQLRFFDRAAVLTDGDTAESGEPRLWRLSTVHRVEELKSIIRMLPIWSVGILLVTAASHNGSFAIMQAKSMDRHLSAAFQIPAATMSVFAIVAMLLTLGLYDRALVPLARRLTGRPSGLTHFQRIGAGLAVSLLANVSAAAVETKRRSAAARHGLVDDVRGAAAVPMSVFWLVPQYAIHGVADALSTVGNLEFLYDQSPESMRSTAAALFWLSISVGSFAGTALVTAIDRCTRGRGDWLQDNINRGRLDCYYWLVTGLQLFNFLAFLLAAKFYTYKPLELAGGAADGPPNLAGDGVDRKGETGPSGRPQRGSEEEGPGSSDVM
ncbi:putative protein NRT1/ PTR FAMILY 3.1 [Iris pallida]|uniref:Protein NRT1/ PTR FAMILY 3.1 n=1 Tax=Iris pallida TaxID=29817 RepID=A0AAX6GNQ1_IRIPA|nr:putative protein NRT1/ PTR FAMILY 3.1 [Iris pallida]